MHSQAQQQVQHMLEKLEFLSPERLIEVEDFIDFLRQRDEGQPLNKVFSQASNTAFAKIWDNEEDAVYDSL